MGLQEVLQTVFGAANAAAHEKAVQLIQGLTFPGIITDQEAERIVKAMDEIATATMDEMR